MDNKDKKIKHLTAEQSAALGEVMKTGEISDKMNKELNDRIPTPETNSSLTDPDLETNKKAKVDNKKSTADNTITKVTGIEVNRRSTLKEREDAIKSTVETEGLTIEDVYGSVKMNYTDKGLVAATYSQQYVLGNIAEYVGNKVNQWVTDDEIGIAEEDRKYSEAQILENIKDKKIIQDLKDANTMYGSEYAYRLRMNYLEDLENRAVIDKAGFWESTGSSVLSLSTDPTTYLGGFVIKGLNYMLKGASLTTRTAGTGAGVAAYESLTFNGSRQLADSTFYGKEAQMSYLTDMTLGLGITGVITYGVSKKSKLELLKEQTKTELESVDATTQKYYEEKQKAKEEAEKPYKTVMEKTKIPVTVTETVEKTEKKLVTEEIKIDNTDIINAKKENKEIIESSLETAKRELEAIKFQKTEAEKNVVKAEEALVEKVKTEADLRKEEIDRQKESLVVAKRTLELEAEKAEKERLKKIYEDNIVALSEPVPYKDSTLPVGTLGDALNKVKKMYNVSYNSAEQAAKRSIPVETKTVEVTKGKVESIDERIQLLKWKIGEGESKIADKARAGNLKSYVYNEKHFNEDLDKLKEKIVNPDNIEKKLEESKKKLIKSGKTEEEVNNSLKEIRENYLDYYTKEENRLKSNIGKTIEIDVKMGNKNISDVSDKELFDYKTRLELSVLEDIKNDKYTTIIDDTPKSIMLDKVGNKEVMSDIGKMFHSLKKNVESESLTPEQRIAAYHTILLMSDSLRRNVAKEGINKSKEKFNQLAKSIYLGQSGNFKNVDALVLAERGDYSLLDKLIEEKHIDLKEETVFRPEETVRQKLQNIFLEQDSNINRLDITENDFYLSVKEQVKESIVKGNEDEIPQIMAIVDNFLDMPTEKNYIKLKQVISDDYGITIEDDLIRGLDTDFSKEAKKMYEDSKIVTEDIETGIDLGIKNDLSMSDRNNVLIKDLERLDELERTVSGEGKKKVRKLADLIIQEYETRDKSFYNGSIRIDKNVELTVKEKHEIIKQEVQNLINKRTEDVTEEQKKEWYKQIKKALGFDRDSKETKVKAEVSEEIQVIGKTRELEGETFIEGGTSTVDSDTSGMQGLNFRISVDEAEKALENIDNEIEEVVKNLNKTEEKLITAKENKKHPNKIVKLEREISESKAKIKKLEKDRVLTEKALNDARIDENNNSSVIADTRKLTKFEVLEPSMLEKSKVKVEAPLNVKMGEPSEVLNNVIERLGKLGYDVDRRAVFNNDMQKLIKRQYEDLKTLDDDILDTIPPALAQKVREEKKLLKENEAKRDLLAKELLDADKELEAIKNIKAKYTDEGKEVQVGSQIIKVVGHIKSNIDNNKAVLAKAEEKIKELESKVKNAEKELIKANKEINDMKPYTFETITKEIEETTTETIEKTVWKEVEIEIQDDDIGKVVRAKNKDAKALEEKEEAVTDYQLSGEDAGDKLVNNYSNGILDSLGNKINKTFGFIPLTHKMRASKSPVMRFLANKLLEDPVGNGGLRKRAFSASVIKEHNVQIYNKDVIEVLHSTVEGFAKKLGVSMPVRFAVKELSTDTSKVMYDFNKQLRLYVNDLSMGRDVSQYPEEIVRMAESYNGSFNLMFDEMAAREVLGFESGKYRHNYLPQLHNNKAIIELAEKIGVDKVIDGYKRGYMARGKSEEDAINMATSLIDNIIEEGNLDLTEKIASSVSSRARERADIDLSVKIGDVQLADLIETDVFLIWDRYKAMAAGYNALYDASKGLIKSQKDIEQFTAMIRADKSLTDKEIEVAIRDFTDAMDLVLSRPTRGGLPEELIDLRDIANLAYMGGLGMASLVDASKILSKKFLGVFSSQVFVNKVLTGDKMQRELFLNDIVSITNIRRSDGLLLRQITNFDTKVDKEASNFRKFMKTSVSLLTGGKRVKALAARGLNTLSGQNKVMEYMREISQEVLVLELLKAHKNNKVNNRLIDLGLADKNGLDKDLQEAFNLVSYMRGGEVVERLNVELWSEEAKRKLGLGTQRYMKQEISQELAGEMPSQMNNPYVKLLLQFRATGILNQNKQLQRSLMYADREAVEDYITNLMWAGVVRYAKLSMWSRATAGLSQENYKSPKEEQLEVHKYIRANGIVSDVVDLMTKTYKASEKNDFSFLSKEVPTVQFLYNYAKGAGLLGDGVDVNTLQKNIPLQTTILGRLVLEGFSGVKLGSSDFKIYDEIEARAEDLKEGESIRYLDDTRNQGK